MADYEQSVFINCPFDDEFAPLLEAMLFCVVRAGLEPRLASESLESGGSRLEKIIELVAACRYSIHDMSLAVAAKKGDFFRMNMPFELGLDMGRRRSPDVETNNKKFLIFERKQYDLKRSLSDLAGTDVEFHDDDFQLVIQKTRNFLKVEAQKALPGPTALQDEYSDFLGWMTDHKMNEGHTEEEARTLPTKERLDAMKLWMDLGRPTAVDKS